MEYRVIQVHSVDVSTDELEQLLQGGWHIDRADCVRNGLIYILKK